MIGSNTAGCTFFVKALQGSESSLPATVASAATNYFCSVSRKIKFIPSLVFTVYDETHLTLSGYRESLSSTISVRHCRHQLNSSQRHNYY